MTFEAPDAQFTLHLPGVPPSFNKVGHSGNRWAWTRAEGQWKGYCYVALIEARVPKTIEFVRATALLHFTTNRKRDVGNYRTILEKALGDALQLHGLPDDDPEHFEFPTLEFGIKEKKPRTIVTLECRLK